MNWKLVFAAILDKQTVVTFTALYPDNWDLQFDTQLNLTTQKNKIYIECIYDHIGWVRLKIEHIPLDQNEGSALNPT